MSRWFRVYADLVDDPKFIKLSADLRSALLMMWCVASKHENGYLPALDDVAIKFRLSEAKTKKLLDDLERHGLIDRDETGLRPHNWDHRQFKSDVSNERVKRYRQRKCNVTETVTVTPPDNREQIQNTETDNSEAYASGAKAPDPRTRLFGEGLAKLALMTGKGPDACRSFVGKCLKAADDDAVTVLGLIEEAERNRVINPSGWIAARLKGDAHAKTPSRIIQAADDLCRKIASFDGPARAEIEVRSGEGEAPVGLLSHG